jgi:DNA topoisomerase-1
MKKTLIICEKPSAASRIAAALAKRRPKKQELSGVPYYEFERDGKKLVVVPALGHLYTLKNVQPIHDYPVYDIDWMPTFEVDKKAERARVFAEAIRELAKDADEFISACDYDLEGEVIAYNVLRHLCGEDAVDRAKRMKFSTLTSEDLRRAYERMMPHLDFGLVDAGVTRHVLDWYWGQNISKAMSASVEAAHQRFAKLSAGRVQTPALRILAEREREIEAFEPEPFWVLSLLLELEGKEVVAEHATPRFFDKAEAERALKACKGKPARVVAIQTRQYRRPPPVPFDLGLLQSEAYRCFGYTPLRTQQIAQALYQAALISYPRTSSQKLPPAINYKEIIRRLGEVPKYRKIADDLLAMPELKPNEGKKVDPAHPSIHPTTEKPKELTGPQQKLYDLIVRRFFSVFGKPALVESVRVELDVGGQPFYLRGRRVLDPGWLAYYGRYGATEEIVLPSLSEGQTLAVREIKFEEKETQPPPRYNPASIVKELERLNLGTKCLCGNVLVLTSNPNHHMKIEELFNVSAATCYAFNPETFEVIPKPASLLRRETKPGERVLRIHTNHGFVEVTEEHPFFVLEDGKISCKQARDIQVGDELVSYIPRDERDGGIILDSDGDWEMLYGVGEDLANRIKTKRKQLGLSQYEFARMFGISQSVVSEHESGRKIPISILGKLDIIPSYIAGRSASTAIPYPFPIRMSSCLARVLARLAGDGSFGSAQFERENSCDFRYCNTTPTMIQSFVRDIAAVFRFKQKIACSMKGRKRRLYRTKLPGAIGRILLRLAPEIVEHRVPRVIRENKEFWQDYLSALFDDEATVPSREFKVRFTQKNKRLVFEVIKMLNKLGIRTNKPKFENGSWKVQISGRRNVEKFLLRIGLNHPMKLQRLLNNASRCPVIKRKAEIYYLLSKGMKPVQIVKELGHSDAMIHYCIRELVLDGLVENIRSWSGWGGGSKSDYKVKIPFSSTFYALLDSRIITDKLCLKRVSKIEEKERPKFVYDITIDHESPAFVAGEDNVIVHNSTRAPILQNIYERGYIFGQQITVTDLGMEVIDALSKHCPEIINEELTAQFEREMEAIQEGKKDKDEVIARARAELDKILKKFKKHELAIGKELGEAYRRTKQKQRILGSCSKCDGVLKVIVSRRTRKRFAGCSNYPKCDNSFPLPQFGFITALDKTCEQCETPMIQVKRTGMRPYRMCLSPKCPSKKDWGKKKAAQKKGSG